MENGNKRREGKDVLLMVYRKIAETCQGYEILERLTEEEMAAYYRNKKNRKKKENRQATISAYVFCALAGAVFFVMPVISILVAGIM